MDSSLYFAFPTVATLLNFPLPVLLYTIKLLVHFPLFHEILTLRLATLLYKGFKALPGIHAVIFSVLSITFFLPNIAVTLYL